MIQDLKARVKSLMSSTLGYSVGEGTTRFFKHLSWIGVCFFFSKIVGSVATALAARWLGKTAFGEASLVVGSAGQIFYLIMLFGMHLSIIRYVSGNKRNPGSIVGLALALTTIMSLIVGGVVFAFPNFISHIMGVSPEILWYGFHFAVVFTIYMLFTSLLQAVNDFRARGLVELMFSLVLLPAFLLGFWIAPGRFESLVVAYIAAYALPSMLLVGYALRKVSPVNLAVTPDQGRDVIHYGLLNTIGLVGYMAIFAIQPLQINDMLSRDDVGVYRVYLMGTVGLSMFATNVLQAVFFPKASASSNRLEIWHTLMRLWRWAAPIVFIGFVVTGAAIVMVSGVKEYGFRLPLLLMFAAAATLISVQASVGMLITAQGVRGARYGILLSTTTAITSLVGTKFLVPQFGLVGGAATLVLTYTVAMAGTVLLRFVLDEKPAE